MKKKITINEFRAQAALGTIPKEFSRFPGERPRHPRGTRKCGECGNKITKSDLFYDKGNREKSYNVCVDCSYISVIQALKLLEFGEDEI